MQFKVLRKERIFPIPLSIAFRIRKFYASFFCEERKGILESEMRKIKLQKIVIREFKG